MVWFIWGPSVFKVSSNPIVVTWWSEKLVYSCLLVSQLSAAKAVTLMYDGHTAIGPTLSV